MAFLERVAYAGDSSLYAMSRHHCVPPRRTAIGPGLQALLAKAVGIKAARVILPDLERAVEWYLEFDASSQAEYHDSKWDARNQELRAADLAKAAAAYGAALLNVRSDSYAIHERQIVIDGQDNIVPLGDFDVDEELVVVAAVEEAASQFAQDAHSQSLSARGRQRSNRLHLAVAVVRVLRAFDLPTLVSRDRDFSRVLSIAYEAADVPVPLDLMRDMAKAVELADAIPPDPDRTNPSDFLIGPRECLRPRPTPPSRRPPRRSRAAHPAKRSALINR